MKVVALAGGVGGARLADGLAQALPPEDLSIIVNTADDFEHFGLHISPDLDTVCYTLAGIANPATGWGQESETWNAMEAVSRLGGPDWFRLGDKDLGTHLERTRQLQAGIPLSAITWSFCQAWGVKVRILPMSNDPVRTIVRTKMGDLPFQDYFVRQHCEPPVTGFVFDGVARARPAPGVLEAIGQADLVVICPSNPWVSIDPILAVPGIRAALTVKVVIAVTPIIAGKAIKGPAAKMYTELGIQPSAYAVARHYRGKPEGGLLSGFVLDKCDEDQVSEICELGVLVKTTQTLMLTGDDRKTLAREVLEFGREVIAESVKQCSP